MSTHLSNQLHDTLGISMSTGCGGDGVCEREEGVWRGWVFRGRKGWV